MRKNEQKRFEAKLREWDEDYRVFRQKTGWFFKRFNYYKKYMINWYFFYTPEDKGDKSWHVMGVILIDIIILRVFGLI